MADDSSTEYWPDRVEYLPAPPQVQKPAAVFSEAQQAAATPQKQVKHKQKDKDSDEKKPGFWAKRRKAKEDKKPGPSEEQIVEVGPRDIPASPDPLLRLPMPIRVEGGIIPAGFYLLHARNIGPTSAELVLIQKNSPVLRFSVSRDGGTDDDNKTETGTASPIEKLPLPPGQALRKAEIKLSADQQSLVIVLLDNKTRYSSAPFPLAVDQRHRIGY